MDKNTAFAENLVKHVFQNAALLLIGDAGGLLPSATAGSLYIGLHTADPTGGDQTTNEATYTNYARVGVARSAAQWPSSGSGSVTNQNPISFAVAGGATANTISHVSVGTASSGAGSLLYVGKFPAPIGVNNGQQVVIAANDLNVREI